MALHVLFLTWNTGWHRIEDWQMVHLQMIPIIFLAADRSLWLLVRCNCKGWQLIIGFPYTWVSHDCCLHVLLGLTPCDIVTCDYFWKLSIMNLYHYRVWLLVHFWFNHSEPSPLPAATEITTERFQHLEQVLITGPLCGSETMSVGCWLRQGLNVPWILHSSLFYDLSVK